jgi:arginyl-tRNA synthetase
LKEGITTQIGTALIAAAQKVLGEGGHGACQLERARGPGHGDYACSIALALAKAAGRPPRALAEEIVAALRQDMPAPLAEMVERIEIAGPGFINFFLRQDAFFACLSQCLTAGAAYGRGAAGAGQRILVEYVSANPTGPLHIGHGRGAAYGSVVANLLDAIGCAVVREYYVNDAGRQMDILALSVWLRYLPLAGFPDYGEFPQNAYRGEYVKDIAAALHRDGGDVYCPTPGFRIAPPVDGDVEAAVDAAICDMRAALGPERFALVHAAGLNDILAGIEADLRRFGVTFDAWFSERSLLDNGAVTQALAQLRAGGHLYEKDGAEWFRSTAFGDEKDRVVIRENGQNTYFATDIAYHWQKLARGFDHLINIWGADHHGYIPRIKAVIAALGGDPTRLEVLLVQFATLYRGSERVQMSTRSGEFITLQGLYEEVGVDATRFFYVMRRSDQHLDFDMELATSRSSENPVYYVQYAHARIVSLFRKLAEKGLGYDQGAALAGLDRLTEPAERVLAALLGRFPAVVETAALAREPHQIVHYLRDLANEFHVYYNQVPILADEDGQRRAARLALLAACRQVIANGLGLLGVTAPETM